MTSEAPTESTPGSIPRGRALLNDPTNNKGTAFSQDEREKFGLEGLLPTRVEDIDEQCARIRDKYDRLHDDLERHIFLRAVQDSNQTLFYAFVENNLIETLPILSTPQPLASRAKSSATSIDAPSDCSSATRTATE